MEDHLTNKDRLQKEWDTLCAYDAEPCSVVAAIEPTNMRKNRFTDILPCMHASLTSGRLLVMQSLQILMLVV